MTQYGTWVSYEGAARIWLAVGLFAIAVGLAYAGIKLPLPIRLARVKPRAVTVVVLLAAWVAAIVAFVVCASIYVHRYVSAYHLKLSQAAPVNHITPITFLAAAAVFFAVLARSSSVSSGAGTRLGSAVIAGIIGPVIFELPFDLIVMARVYPPVPPDPAFYRALFFVPLFLVEIASFLLLRLSPMVRLTRTTFFAFALMLGVFAIWALSGFGYPSAPVPTTLNIVSKLLAFVTALSLFLYRLAPPSPAPGPATPAPAPAPAPAPGPAAPAPGPAAPAPPPDI
jgi:hypothetical protein